MISSLCRIVQCKSKIKSRSASICGRSIAVSTTYTSRRSLALYRETRFVIFWGEENSMNHVKPSERPANLCSDDHRNLLQFFLLVYKHTMTDNNMLSPNYFCYFWKLDTLSRRACGCRPFGPRCKSDLFCISFTKRYRVGVVAMT